jgi:hypothetical protein
VFEHPTRKLPLKDLIKGLSLGFPGLETSSVTPSLYAHLLSAKETNSGPLSAWVRSGYWRRSFAMFVSTRTTSSPVSDWATSMAKHSWVWLSTTVKVQNFLLSNNASDTKSMLRLWFCPVSMIRPIRSAAAFLLRSRLVFKLRPSVLYSLYIRV